MAVLCQRIFIVMAHSPRGLVDSLDFITTLGHGTGGGARRRLGIHTEGPAKVITDLCVMEPDGDSRELTVTSLHPGVTREAVAKATGWPVKFSGELTTTAAPTATELDTLRALRANTAKAHGDA